mgnify:FL=1
MNENDELLAEFMSAYYSSKDEIPPKIYVPTEDGLNIISEWIKNQFDANPQIILVNDGIENAPRHKAAMNMAAENAKGRV